MNSRRNAVLPTVVDNFTESVCWQKENNSLRKRSQLQKKLSSLPCKRSAILLTLVVIVSVVLLHNFRERTKYVFVPKTQQEKDLMKLLEKVASDLEREPRIPR